MNNHLAEQSVIGGLLIDPSKLPDVLEYVTGSDFYDFKHQSYFKAIDALAEAKEPVDVTTVCDWLQDMGYKPDIGYLVTIAQGTPSTANIHAYARAVKDCSTERKLLGMADEMAGIVRGDGRTSDKIEAINQLMSGLSRDDKGAIRDASSIMVNLIDQWQTRFERDNALMGYSTGFIALDNRTMGLQAPDLTIIAAGSGRGKTTLAMNMVESVAIHQNKPVLVFSLEMSGEQLLDRLTASVGRIPLKAIKSGKVFGSEHETALVPAASKIKSSNLHIDDRGGLTIGQIQATARKFFRQHGEGLLVVDYIGLVTGKGQSKEEKIASVSGGLKTLAKELSIPVVALAQINRNGVQRGCKRPLASDLRDSAAIEHDADALIMLFEDEVDNPGVMEAHFVKLRNGEPGTDYLLKRLDINRFENMASGYEPEEKDSAPKKYY
jgi:replicative DNA helicase